MEKKYWMSSLIIVLCLGYILYECVFKFMFLPKDYRSATHIYKKKINSCADLVDSISITHKYKGGYIFVLKRKDDKLYDFWQTNSAKNSLEQNDSIRNITAQILKSNKVQLKAHLFDNKKEYAQVNLTDFRFYAWDKKMQEVIMFHYDVPENVPLNKQLTFVYNFSPCSQELINSLGECELELYKESSKW